jgi:hypothetical protein
VGQFKAAGVENWPPIFAPQVRGFFFPAGTALVPAVLAKFFTSFAAVNNLTWRGGEGRLNFIYLERTDEQPDFACGWRQFFRELRDRA